MKKILLLSFLVFTCAFFKTKAQANFLWAKSMAGSGTGEGFSIATDNLGNVYTTGQFGDTVDFDPGSGIYNLTSAGYFSAFASKLDASGNFIYAKSIGDSCRGHSIALDDAGNVYVLGSFQGTADFDPGSGVYNLTSQGIVNVFITKLDANGNFVWVKNFGNGLATDKSMKIDVADNIYITGFFANTVDFDPGTGIHNFVSSGSADIFILKLDSAGNFVWAKSMGSSAYDVAYSIAIDAACNVYTTGTFGGTADFDPGSGVYNLTPIGTGDAFVCKLDSAGNFLWAGNFGGNNTSAEGYALTTDAAGNVYTTGVFDNSADFDPGPAVHNLIPSVFISKLDASGSFVWAKSLVGIGAAGQSIAIDGADNVYTTGYFGYLDFDPGSGTHYLNSGSYKDIFISVLNSNGSYVCAKQIGGPTDDWGTGIAVDPSGNICATGYFSGTCDFDPDTSVYNLTTVPANYYDIYIVKFDNSVGIQEISSNENLINAYPNPATNSISIALQNASVSSLEFSIQNSLGETFLQKNISLSTSNIFTEDISMLSDGIYIASIKTEHGVTAKKIVVQH